ncbi:MAG: hypothetical protein KGM16_20030, partial [Bacteroidota bacterium]|nr:hypothetical protein [Bacteroidota bacterium]
IKVDYYIPTATTDNSTADGLSTIINALGFIIDNSPVTATLHGSGSTITTDLNTSSPFTNFMQPQNGSTGTTLPKAYLNIIFFDNQFNYVSGEFVQVSTEGSGQTIYRIGGNAKVAPKNGFAYIYVSNESNNLVYFDNLQVTHEHGPLLQENHYYPYGLGMAGISSSAITAAMPNAYKANGGSELGSSEWADGSGLEMYETTYRSFNAQIGRFMQADILSELAPVFSPYRYAFDNPIIWNDPSGLKEGNASDPTVLATVYIYMPVTVLGLSEWESFVDERIQAGGGGGGGGDDGGGSWGGGNNWGFSGLHGSGNAKGPGEKNKKTKKSSKAENLEKASAAVQLGTDAQATAWGAIAKFGSKELEKFGRYATGTGAAIASADFAAKVASGNASWKDYVSFGLAWANVGLMKASETSPNVYTATAEVVVGVFTVGFDIYNSMTSN